MTYTEIINNNISAYDLACALIGSPVKEDSSCGWWHSIENRDSSASMQIFKAKNRGFRDFSANKYGDVVCLYQYISGETDRLHSCVEIAKRFGVKLPVSKETEEERKKRIAEYKKQKRLEDWAKDEIVFIHLYYDIMKAWLFENDIIDTYLYGLYSRLEYESREFVSVEKTKELYNKCNRKIYVELKLEHLKRVNKYLYNLVNNYS